MALEGAALVMQYAITLPADYDMSIIRTRVRDRGGALDDREGLLLKAYCVQEIGIQGATVNQYAPFYLWRDPAAAAQFLWRQAGFEGIVRDFGRPTVRTWLPTCLAFGSGRAEDVSYAVLETAPIHPARDLTAVARELDGEVERRLSSAQTHAGVAGIDPASWESVVLSTHASSATAVRTPASVGYSVLHVSQPHHR